MGDIKVLGIKDSALAAGGCKASWGLGNQLFVSAGSKRCFRDEPSGGIEVVGAPYIHVVKWDTDMHLPFTRKLVNETCSIFVRIQQLMSSFQTSTNRNGLILKHSKEYRSVIKACIMELNQTKSSVARDEIKVADQMKMLEMSEFLWSLCEILLIESIPGGMIIRQLLDWWQLHFLEQDTKTCDDQTTESVFGSESYWNSIIHFVLRGQLDDARRMLSLHSNGCALLFSKMDGLLKSMPQYHKFVCVPNSEFDMCWLKWSSECKRHVNENTFIAEPNLHLVCRILAGEVQVFYELHEFLGTWYCMLISKMLYTNPSVQAADLQFHVNDCISAYFSLSSIKQWDSIILAAIEMDIHQVIQRCSAEFRDWWLVTHLTDLLHHHGVLEPHVHSFGINLRDFLIVEYAISLLSHQSLWQVGIAYLEYCSDFGRNIMAEFVEHFPIENEKMAYTMLNICEKNGLLDQVKSIYKVMGMQALHNNRLGSALSWGLKSKDAVFVASVSERYLNEYNGSGSFSSIDLIDSLGSSMLLTTKLTFLGKYREFHQLYAKANLFEAAALLLSLLTARVAPTKFWSTLLLDAIPLLEADKVIFNTKETYELLHCLEELNVSQKLDSNRKISTKEVMEDKFTILRLALARNLSRALVEESSNDSMII